GMRPPAVGPENEASSGTFLERVLDYQTCATRKFRRLEWRRGGSNHPWNNSGRRTLTATYTATRASKPRAMLAQSYSVFLMRGHRFWNRSKARRGVQATDPPRRSEAPGRVRSEGRAIGVQPLARPVQPEGEGHGRAAQVIEYLWPAALAPPNNSVLRG